MKIRHAGGRRVSVIRTSWPVRGEKAPRRVAVMDYGIGMTGGGPRPVASVPHVDTPRWQQFVIEDTPDGEKLLAALQKGPAKVRPRGDAWVIDIDRIERP